MRLLIVVDKLLTGFDAPPATYLYIDKKMRDHGLFQAICRVNRLDGDDKDYGYIVDYRDLFNSLESAITDYTGGALDGYEKQDIEGLLHGPPREGTRGSRRGAGADPRPLRAGRAAEGHAAVPAVLLCRRAGQRRAAQGQRAEARRAVQGSRGRDPLPTATSPTRWTPPGTPPPKLPPSRPRSPTTPAVRDEVKLGAGENVDFKQYEAGMRLLLDTYIQADASGGHRRLRGHRAYPAHRQARCGRDRQAAEGHQDKTPRQSPRRSPTTCAR